MQIREYQLGNLTKKGEWSRGWRERNHGTVKYRAGKIMEGMVARSKKKGFPYPTISRADIEIAIQGVCAKTGIPFEFDRSQYSKSPWTPVPDRIDSTKPYTPDNVQWVCHMYNSMKQEYTDVEIDIFISALIEAREKH